METITIQKNACLTDTRDNANYRVIHNTENHIIVVGMDNPTRLDIRLVSAPEMIKLVKSNVVKILEPPPCKIIDPTTLSENNKIRYTRNKLIVDTINKQYAPDYLGLIEKRGKPLIEDLLKASGLSRPALWHIIIKYLQSGLQESSLLRKASVSVPKDTVTKLKRGRKSTIEDVAGKNLEPADYENMERFLKKYLSNKEISIKKCYDDMVSECYKTTIFDGQAWTEKELPLWKIPSYDQFYYHVRQHSTKAMRREAKLGRREFRNAKRLLTGTSLSGISGPGDVFEIDACELDIAVVSATDRSKAVGSPVVYFMIDVYSRLIVGASISFDNNSILAMTNCLASLVEDKKEVLKSVGIEFQPTKSILSLEEALPSGIKPHVLRMDHGSDFISKQSQLIANEMNIELQYVPPGTGSLKGVVERSFRSYQKFFIDLTLKNGTKEHNDVSKHNQEARLTIEDVKKLMYLFILSHNTTVREGYTLTPDMIANKIGNVPAEIWRYGVNHIANPAYIPDHRQFLFSLMVPEKAKLKRSGIHYQGLRYIPDLNEDPDIAEAMITTMNGSAPFDIRIDLRSTAQIYYLDKNGILRSAKMVNDINHQELAKLTWPEFKKFKEDASRLMKKKEAETGPTRRAIRQESRQTVETAKALSGKDRVDTKNMRETRALEKARVAKELSFDKKFGLGTVPAIAEPEPKSLPDEVSFNAEPESHTKNESPQVPVIRANKILNPESTDALNPASVPKKRGRKPNSFKDIKKFAEPKVNPPKQKSVKTDSKAETKGNEADNMLPWKGNVIAEPAVKSAFSENLSDFQSKAAESQANVSDFQDNATEDQTSSMESEHILTEEERRKKVLQDIIDMCEEYEDGDY